MRHTALASACLLAMVAAAGCGRTTRNGTSPDDDLGHHAGGTPSDASPGGANAVPGLPPEVAPAVDYRFGVSANWVSDDGALVSQACVSPDGSTLFGREDAPFGFSPGVSRVATSALIRPPASFVARAPLGTSCRFEFRAPVAGETATEASREPGLPRSGALAPRPNWSFRPRTAPPRAVLDEAGLES